MGGWLPIGQHEEVDRRHRIFDLLSSKVGTERSGSDICKPEIAEFILNLLESSSGEIVAFANQYLAHRVHLPGRRDPDFSISLATIEHSITTLWKCYNVYSSIFCDGFTTPNVIHLLDSFTNLGLPVAGGDAEAALIQSYETVKERMESATSMYARIWQTEFAHHSEATE